MTYVETVSTSEIAPGAMLAAEAAGKKLLIANVDGAFYAMQRKCPHMGADLCKGSLDGKIVTCRMHHAEFDVTSGTPVAKAKLLFLKMSPGAATTYPVKVEGGRILVAV